MVVREYPLSPIVAVGGILIERGRVLLVRRGKEPMLGQWSIPGGAVEVGEKLKEALCREILEETGLTVRILEMVEVLDRILYDEAGTVQYHYVLVDYLCRVEGGLLQPATDVSEARWVDRKDVSSYGLRPETLLVVEKAFSMTAKSPGAED